MISSYLFELLLSLCFILFVCSAFMSIKKYGPVSPIIVVLFQCVIFLISLFIVLNIFWNGKTSFLNEVVLIDLPRFIVGLKLYINEANSLFILVISILMLLLSFSWCGLNRTIDKQMIRSLVIISLVLFLSLGVLCIDNIFLVVVTIELLMFTISLANVKSELKLSENKYIKDYFKSPVDVVVRILAFGSLIWINNKLGTMSFSALLVAVEENGAQNITLPLSILTTVFIYYGLAKFEIKSLTSKREELFIPLLYAVTIPTINIYFIAKLVSITRSTVNENLFIQIPIMLLAFMYVISSLRCNIAEKGLQKLFTVYFLLTSIGLITGAIVDSIVYFIIHIVSLTILIVGFQIWFYYQNDHSKERKRVSLHEDKFIFWILLFSSLSLIDFPGLAGYFNANGFLWAIINSQTISLPILSSIFIIMILTYSSVVKFALENMSYRKRETVGKNRINSFKYSSEYLFAKIIISIFFICAVIVTNSLTLSNFISKQGRLLQQYIANAISDSVIFSYDDHIIFVVMVIQFVSVFIVISTLYYILLIIRPKQKNRYYSRKIKMVISMIDYPFASGVVLLNQRILDVMLYTKIIFQKNVGWSINFLTANSKQVIKAVELLHNDTRPKSLSGTVLQILFVGFAISLFIISSFKL